MPISLFFPLPVIPASESCEFGTMTAFVPNSAISLRSRDTTSTTVTSSTKSCTFVARRGLRTARLSTHSRGNTVNMVATGEPLEDWLHRVDRNLGKCTRGIFSACKEIAYKIRTASCDKMSCFNDFGDEQLAIDVLADKVIFDNLKSSGVVATASSEEMPEENPITEGGEFSVAFDPLDGSSIIDTNFSVGT